MGVFRECENYETCLEHRIRVGDKTNYRELNALDCEGCHTYNIYKKGFEDGANAVIKRLNKLEGK